MRWKTLQGWFSRFKPLNSGFGRNFFALKIISFKTLAVLLKRQTKLFKTELKGVKNGKCVDYWCWWGRGCCG
jgi:hypothetical protein